MPYVKEGSGSVWRPGPGESALPKQAQITSQLDSTKSAGADWRKNYEVTSDSGPEGARFQAKSGGGGKKAAPATASPAAPTGGSGGGAGGGGGLPIASQPPSLAGLDAMGGGGGAPSEGAAPHQLSGPTTGRGQIGSRMPPSLAALLKYRVY